MFSVKNTISFTYYNCLFYYAKLSGLIPIQILTQNQTHAAKSSWFSISYSILSATIVIPLVTACAYFIISVFVYLKNDHVTMVIVIVIANLINTFKTMWLYICQILNHKKLVKLINDAFKLRKIIMKYFAINGALLDKHCRKMTHTRIMLTVVQILLSFGGLGGVYMAHGFSVVFYVDLVLAMLTDILYMLFACVYFGSMMLVLQFYRYLNKELKIAIKQIPNITLNYQQQDMIKTQMYCDVSDTIDQIANFYDEICVFTMEFNSFFTISLALALLYAFLCGLSWV